ncbi:MAG: oligosaccharide flippase family protein [Clostridia bacterium]|nr:oligosaccharide flippase family protein [Clostridia bacterium]
MENKKRFLYNGILLTLVGISIRTVSLLFNALITRTIGAEGVGLYTIVMNVYGFAVTFATSGISLTVTRLVAAAKGEGKANDVSKILAGAVVYTLAFSIIATSVLFFGANFFAYTVLDDKRAAAALKILAPSLVPLSLVSVFSGYFVGVKRVSCNAVTQVLGQIFKICATVWLILRALPMDVEKSARMLSLGTTVTEILCFLVIFVEFLIDRRKAYKGGGADVRSVASVAVPLGVSAYIRQALLTVEHILIPKRLRVYGHSLSDSLASYGTLHGMALPMILYPMVTLSSFSGLLVPEFAERSAQKNDEAMRALASRAFGVTLIYATLASAVLFVFSEELGYVIYKSSDAGRYIAILAPVVPIMYLDHVTDSVLKGIGEQVCSMWINITDSVLSIVLVWFLIPKMGIIGYAVCIIVMEGYNFILSAIRLFSKIKFRISLTETLLYPLISALFSGALVKKLFISAGRQTDAFWLILEIIFSVCAFALMYKFILFVNDRIKILPQKCK